MPIPVTTVLPPTPPPPPPQLPTDPATHGRVVGTWTSPGGDTLLLSDCSTGVDWLAGREGEDMPPFEITEDPNIDVDGSTIRGVRALPRNVGLPILLHRDTYGQWRALQQRLARAMDPLRGDGKLTLKQPDGTSRVLTARYASGMEGRDIADPKGVWYRIYPLVLRAVDPWWADADPITLLFRTSGAGEFFAPPFLPLKLVGSSVLGRTTAANRGDVPAYPTWRISAPYTGITLTNHTTDRHLVLDTAALAGAPDLLVDTRPGRQAIRLDDGTNRWATRVGTPQLWPLAPGLNDIELAIIGATDATGVDLTYTPRFLTA